MPNAKYSAFWLSFSTLREAQRIEQRRCATSLPYMSYFFHTLSSDLVFTFVDELQPDQTPDSVHLMAQGMNKPK